MYRTHVDGKPRVRAAEEDLHVIPPREVSEEIAKRCSRSNDSHNNGVRVIRIAAGGQEAVDVVHRLLDVSFDIHCESWRLGYGEPGVYSDCGRHTTDAYKDPPSPVDVAENFRVGRAQIRQIVRPVTES